MNKQNKIDQLFAPLRDIPESAPMHLWPDIEAAIAKEPKKKRHFLWFGLLGFLLLAGSSLAVYALKTQESTNLDANQVEAVQPNQNIASISITQSANQATTVAKNNNTPTEMLQTTAQDFSKKITKQNRPSSDQYESIIIASENNQNHITQKTDLPIIEQEAVLTPRNPTHITRPLNLASPMLPQIEMEQPTSNLAMHLPDEECAGSRVIKVPKSIFVDAYVSPVFSNTFFTAKNAELSSYADLRDSTEQNGIGILAGARVGYIHESGLNLRAGIAYQQIKNKFQFNVEQDEKMIIQIFRDNSGNIIGRDTTFEFGRRRLDVSNKYTSVDLPLSFGYISMKNKVQIGFHIGAAINLTFSQSGTYLNRQSTVSQFSDNKIYNNSIGTSFFGSVELQYLLANNWGVFMEPQVRFYPKSLTTNNHPVKQNITNFNVLTGIKYIF